MQMEVFFLDAHHSWCFDPSGSASFLSTSVPSSFPAPGAPHIQHWTYLQLSLFRNKYIGLSLPGPFSQYPSTKGLSHFIFSIRKLFHLLTQHAICENRALKSNRVIWITFRFLLTYYRHTVIVKKEVLLCKSSCGVVSATVPGMVPGVPQHLLWETSLFLLPGSAVQRLSALLEEHAASYRITLVS